MTNELDAQAARFLVTGAGQQFLSRLLAIPDGERAVQVAKWDLSVFAVDPVALRQLVLSVAAATQKAASRYEEPLLFTEELLAQASSPGIASYHAGGFPNSGTITDLGCGAGIDSIAFATRGLSVVAVDNDPVHLILARANAERCGVADRITFVEGDAATIPIATDFVYADPARRTEAGVRVSRHGEQYSPPLAELAERMQTVPGACLKLSPLLTDETLGGLGGRVAFVSEGRECKEATVWFGTAGGVTDPLFSARFTDSALTVGSDEEPARIQPVGEWVYEPDPAIIRVGGVATAAQILGAGLIAGDDVYLTADTFQDTPLARPYRVIEAMPFHRKAVAAYVRKAGFGRVVVKRRRARMTPEAVLAEIKASNRGPEPEVLLILVRESKGHLAVFCSPYQAGS